MSANDVVLAITGASGSAYALRLAQVLLAAGKHLHLVVSGAARQVMARELEAEFPGNGASAEEWSAMIERTLAGPIASAWGFCPLPGSDCTSAGFCARLWDVRLFGWNRERFVSHQWDGDLSVFDGHVVGHRYWRINKSDSARSGCASEGTATAGTCAARDAAESDSTRKHDAPQSCWSDDHAVDAGVLSPADADCGSGGFRRGQNSGPSAC